MSRFFCLLLLAGLMHSALSAPVALRLPCDRPVFAFGAGTAAGDGGKVRNEFTFPRRTERLFRLACGQPVAFKQYAREGDRFLAAIPAILAALEGNRGAIVLVHYPFTDIEAGASIESLLEGYRQVLEACARTDAICVIGGQQPVNSLDQAAADRQLELERRASEEFGSSYQPVYRYMSSERNSRHLMRPVDSGDGRFVQEYGHELLFKLIRNRLLELTWPK